MNIRPFLVAFALNSTFLFAETPALPPAGSAPGQPTPAAVPHSEAEVSAAVEAVAASKLPKTETRKQIAVADFTTDPAGGEEKAIAASRLSGELRIRLANDGLKVLDQVSSLELVNEQGTVTDALAKGNVKLPPMMGVDYVVTGEMQRDGKTLHLSILDIAGKKSAVSEAFDLPAGAPASITEPMMKWVLENVSGKAAADGYALLPATRVDALAQCYNGITLFRQAKWIEATAEFEKAYRLNGKLEEAYLWESRCYEALGMQPLADLMRDYAYRCLIGGNTSDETSAAPMDGTTFLGIAAGNDNGSAACRELEVFITDAASKVAHPLLLPANLAGFRDALDRALHAKKSRGVAWFAAPGFPGRQAIAGVLTKSGDALVLELKINDAARGIPLASEKMTLPPEKDQWQKQIDETVGRLLGGISKPDDGKQLLSVIATLPSVDEIKSHMGRDGNVAVLQLALKDPAALASAWQPLAKPAWPDGAYLNRALLDYLLSKIAADHPMRPWIELECIGDSLPYLDRKSLYPAGTKIDPIAELEKFKQSHASDLPGAVAEYMLLWETMAHTPYADLEKRFSSLDDKMRGFTKDNILSNPGELAGMVVHLRQLSVIAQDDPQRRIPLPKNNFPHRLIPRIQQGGHVNLNRETHWMASEWQHFEVAPEDAVHEARAAIAFLGRGNNRYKVDPAWLRDFPHSHALVSYVIEALRQADTGDSLPLLHPFDAQAERDAYREMVAYAFNELRREVHDVGNPNELDQLESYEIRRFFTQLTLPNYRTTIPDAEFDKMHETLTSDVSEASDRTGRAQRRRYSPYWVDWRLITRAMSPFFDQKYWRNNYWEISDLEYLDTQVSRVLSESGDDLLLDSQWQKLLRRNPWASFSPGMLGNYYLAQYPRLAKDYGGDLSPSETEQVVRFGFVLLNSGHYPEAEGVFRMASDAPESDLNRYGGVPDIRANAALCYAAAEINGGRKPDAERLLKQVLESGRGRTIKTVEGGVDVQSAATRLAWDLRRESLESRPASSTQTHKVSVKVDGYFPGEVTFYFRVPAGYAADPGKPARVLLLFPSWNQNGVEYRGDEESWARFADAHGLFLVTPHFVACWSDPALPQQWMGEAVVQGLAAIKKQYAIRTDQLLLHGHGDGARFIHRFAMWKPELCAAVSVHDSDDWAWQEALPEGLHPLADLKNVPFLVTSSAIESDWHPNVIAASTRFVTYARGAGVPVIWAVQPHTTQRPSPEMREFAQAFFAGVLDGSSGTPFVGDLRNSKFFAADDKRVADIPKQFREDLPTRELAELWGEEEKQ